MSHGHAVIPPVFSGYPVKAFFTTKDSGGDRNAAAEIAGVPPDSVYLPVQKHTDRILVLEHDMEPKVADGVVTAVRGVLVGVQVADCVPVLLYDRKRQVVGAVHAGWRGTAAGILREAIGVIGKRFLSSGPDMLVAIGPSIRQCCYEVGREAAEAVIRATGDGDYCRVNGEKYFLSLQAANMRQAISAGVLPENIWMSGDCTFCLPGRYYSYRFAKGTTGRQAGFIGIV